ncbi:Ribonuclease H-like superfamily [Sesbania bispinosa]|nr:Ribonuclease H-like superfamily [Sesbania bispinosa]
MAGRDDVGPDRIIWRHSNDGTFTTKSANSSLRDFPPTSNSSNWRHLWHWDGPVRARYLLWLIIKGGFKTNLLRWERGCTSSANCPLCIHEVESTSHIFDQEVDALCMGTPVASWIFHNVGSKAVQWDDTSWSLLFGIACWIIWKHRNEAIFQKVTWDPIKVIHHIRVAVREFHAVSNLKVGIQHEKNPICKVVHWEPPKEGWVKWNLDGSVRSQGVHASSGCVLRNEWGNWITGVTRNIGQATITEAELWAFKDASHLSLVRGDQNVWFESDPINAVNFVRQGVSSNHPCFGLVSAILNDIAKIGRTHITHVLCEGNYVADGIAGLGHYFPMGHHVLFKPLRLCLFPFLLMFLIFAFLGYVLFSGA